MSYVRTLAICLLLVYFVGAAGCYCFDLQKKSIMKVLTAKILMRLSVFIVKNCLRVFSAMMGKLALYLTPKVKLS